MSEKKEVTININNVANKFMDKVNTALKDSGLVMASHKYEETTIRQLILSTSAEDLETAVAESMAFEVLGAIAAVEEVKKKK